ncbi:hypothetical protein UCMB321_5226 [Pseudomonas batumici]|uniref:Uncharacterized protein n=1 Tax=Pseudomonas batumici TaxID=226910 RepID=A0A0C2EQM6_9PSED|nr:hypothetical protein UCMB321_5226 [Pseudomonas batumici]
MKYSVHVKLLCKRQPLNCPFQGRGDRVLNVSHPSRFDVIDISTVAHLGICIRVLVAIAQPRPALR